MSDSRRAIQLRSYALAFAVALSPAFFQITYSCERGDTFLLSLELEVSGQDEIVNFITTNRSYAVTASSGTAVLRVVTKDPNSIASYRWFANGTAIGPSMAIGVGGGEVTVTVPNGQTALYVGVKAPEGAFDNYIIDVDRVVPITVAMTNNVTNDIFILPYILEVLPTSPITASQPFTADLGGTAELTEEFLDFWQSVVPGGVSSVVVEDFKATVQTRGGGATGPDVPLALDVAALVPGPTRFCTYPPDQVCTMDSDCIVPPCTTTPLTVVDFPTSIDCAPAGLCDSLGKAQQCTDNGFCVTSSLLLPLEPVLGASYVAGDGVSSGQTVALFGWADNPPPVTAVGVPPIELDGTWNMIIPAYGAGVAGDLGIRLIVDNQLVGTLFLPLEGVMGVDSNGPDGVGVPDDASPTPDSELLSFPVACPFVCGDGIMDACEECDDGNNVDGDGCQADCTLPPSSCNFDMTGSDATPQTQTVDVGCTWNVTNGQFLFPWELSVSVPTPVTGGGMFTADFDGQAAFSEFFLDVLQAVVPGGAATMEIVDLAATVQIRSGATGPDVLLGIDPAAVVPGLTSFCTFPPTTVCTVDGDCVVPPCLPPVLLADVPISTDCSPGGVCDTLGKNALQCLPNGFCVLSEDLFMPLVADSGTFTADASGDVLFGWADQGVPDLTLCPAAAPNCTDLWMPDGSYDLPAAVFSNPTGPIGIRTDTAGLFLAYQCAMGEPGGICSATVQGCLSDADCPGGEACIGLGTNNGVIMPTPDANLISCPIN